MSPRAPINFLKSPLPIILFFSILFFAFSSSLPSLSQALAATYYVDATDGNDSNSGLSFLTPWKTIAKVNASSFNAGDQILFKRGEIWRELLLIPSSGNGTIPISFGAYGTGDSPVITGSNIVTGWALVGGTVYKKDNITTEPHVLSFNNTKLREKDGSRSVVAVNQWDWDSNTLYINAGGNPDNGKVEVGQRSYCINTNGNNYLMIRNLELRGADQAAILVHGNFISVQYNTINNCGSLGFHSGICLWNASNCSIKSNNVLYTYDGIGVTGWNSAICDGNTISGNTISFVDTVGINLNNVGVTNTIVEQNQIDHAGQFYDDCAGISTYMAGSGNIIRRNKSYNGGTTSTRCAGIMIDTGSAPSQIYYNICYGNTNGGIDVTGSGHKIYNNTLYHNNEQAWDSGEINFFYSGTSNCEVINNIAIASPGKYVIRVPQGTTDGHYLDHNVYYPIYALFDWGGYSTNFDGWKSKSKQEVSSLNIDPQLRDPAQGDFSLQPTSPAIKKGTYLGITKDFFDNIVSQEKGVTIGAIEYEGVRVPQNLRILP